MQGEKYIEEGEKLSKELIRKIKEREIVEASRPNKGKEYTGSYEKIDLEIYTDFLASYTCRDLFANREVEYGQY